MKIIKLESENIKRLKAIEITPEGEVVIIGGRNAQGKTSVLDSIEMALAGKRAVPPKPVRDGAGSARIVCDLGDIVVKRAFNRDGKSTLTVENQNGDAQKSPQAILDKLVGELSFDPLEFCKMERAEQLTLLKNLAGLSFDSWDKERESAYQKRTTANREAKELAAKCKDAKTYPDAPAEEQQIATVTFQLTEAMQTHQGYKDLERDTKSFGQRIIDQTIEIVNLENKLAGMRTQNLEDQAAHKKQVDALEDQGRALPNLDALTAQVETTEETNRQARANKAFDETYAEFRAKEKQAADFTNHIGTIDDAKKKALADADMPVDGLGFDEREVLFNGIPFSQASSAQQTRVSMAMGIALNPELRILLIRNGSLLDDDSLTLVGKFAAEHDCQVWIERVGEDDEAAVVIEDGAVK